MALVLPSLSTKIQDIHPIRQYAGLDDERGPN